MLLAPNEVYLFFKLMLPLQFFVNERIGVLKGIESYETYRKIPTQEKFKVRNALFENPHLIDEFIDDNPQDIPLKELAHVSKWKNFVQGEFYVERYLKNGAIFVGEDDRVYAVVGLTQELDDILPKFLLPQLARCTLLPFQGRIVYDGFLQPYKMYLGNNIKQELKEIYNKAKKQNEIITSF